MSWPTDDLTTDSLDSGADRPDRSAFLRLFERVKSIIAARGAANGVAPLDDTARVPAASLPLNEAGGVAGLQSNGKVSHAQLPSDIVLFDVNGTHVPFSNLPYATDNSPGIVALENVGKVKSVEVQRSVSGAGDRVSDVAVGATISAQGVLTISLALVLAEGYVAPPPSPPPPSPPDP